MPWSFAVLSISPSSSVLASLLLHLLNQPCICSCTSPLFKSRLHLVLLLLVTLGQVLVNPQIKYLSFRREYIRLINNFTPLFHISSVDDPIKESCSNAGISTINSSSWRFITYLQFVLHAGFWSGAHLCLFSFQIVLKYLKL